jgi:signal transduction histidine kinase
LNNALKYANATEIDITIQSTDNQLITCEIKDNGIGFDVESAQNKGYGLDNMARRAEGIGAVFNIDSDSKKGTVVSCQL